MNEPRQRRAAAALATGLVALGVMGFSGGCELRGSVNPAQTAVSSVQTAVPGVQTGVPQLQATIQAGSTSVAAVLGDPRILVPQLQTLLAGATVDFTAAPSGVPSDAVTSVSISGSDLRGTFSQLDPGARQAAATGALLVVAQAYPNASVSLTVVDASGQPLLVGTKQPGRAPVIQ